MFRLASFGCNGVNIETDVNQLGFISHYSPIVHDPEFHCSARPEYYGMLAFAMAGRGDMVHLAFSSTNINLTAYATKDASGALWLTAIDKDFARSARIQLDLPSGYHKAEIFLVPSSSRNKFCFRWRPPAQSFLRQRRCRQNLAIRLFTFFRCSFAANISWPAILLSPLRDSR
jgi:hypothetical protein